MALNKNVANTVLSGSTIKGGSVPGWSPAQNNVARQLMMYFMGGGMSRAGASGGIGNGMQESGLSPDSPGGYLFQYIGARFTALTSYAAAIGKPATSVEAQAKFAIHELKTSYPALWTLLTTTKDPAAAALAWSNQYERPAAAAANNVARQAYAQAVFSGITPASGVAADGSGQGSSAASGSNAPSSLLDLFTSPVDTIGGWLASIAVTLIKDTAQGVSDVIVIPFWHWQQRSVSDYTSQLFSTNAWPMLPWTATFWGLGYFLLFTDPDSDKGLLPNLKPTQVERARTTRHTRRLQAIPARRTLVKPKNVQERTPIKPKPRLSTSNIKQVGTLTTTRPQTVRVTGRLQDGGRDSRSEGETSYATVKREGEIASPGRPRNAARRKPDKDHRTRRDSLHNRGRDIERG